MLQDFDLQQESTQENKSEEFASEYLPADRLSIKKHYGY
jgi:hypothetical protein